MEVHGDFWDQGMKEYNKNMLRENDTTQQRLNSRRTKIKPGWLSISIYESHRHPEWYLNKDTVVVVFLETPLQEGKRQLSPS